MPRARRTGNLGRTMQARRGNRHHYRGCKRIRHKTRSLRLPADLAAKVKR